MGVALIGKEWGRGEIRAKASTLAGKPGIGDYCQPLIN